MSIIKRPELFAQRIFLARSGLVLDTAALNLWSDIDFINDDNDDVNDDNDKCDSDDYMIIT